MQRYVLAKLGCWRKLLLGPEKWLFRSPYTTWQQTKLAGTVDLASTVEGHVKNQCVEAANFQTVFGVPTFKFIPIVILYVDVFKNQLGSRPVPHS